MCHHEFSHNFERPQRVSYVFGNRIGLVVVIGKVLDVESEYFGIKLITFGLIFVISDLENYCLDLHSNQYLNQQQTISNALRMRVEGIQSIQLMKGESQKQFGAQRNIIKKALKSLVQKKQEIRIHFLNNNTLHVRKADLEKKNNVDIDTNDASPPPKHKAENNKEIDNQNTTNADQNRAKSSDRQEDLFQVIYRNASRMQSIGWHEQRPIRRTSNMSRTFRRRRRSNLQDYSTINQYNECGNDDGGLKMLKNSRIAINNLQLSGFTNQEILKKSTISIQHKQSPRNTRQNKCSHILTLIGDKNFKRAEFIPPLNDTQKGIFTIAANKIKKRWKFQGVSQGSKSARQIINPQITLSNWEQKIHIQKPSHKQMIAAKKSLQSFHHHDHPFLKQMKPTQMQRKKVQQKRSYSQFLGSRPKNHQQYQTKNIPNVPIQEYSCRPWSVFRNLEQKLDEGKQNLQQPSAE